MLEQKFWSLLATALDEALNYAEAQVQGIGHAEAQTSTVSMDPDAVELNAATQNTAKGKSEQEHDPKVEAELAIFDNLTMERQNTEDAPKEDPEEAKLQSLYLRMFERFDFDQSGTINSYEELMQLTTGLAFHFNLSVSSEDLKKICESHKTFSERHVQTDGWDLPTFRQWFEKHMLQQRSQ